jgi:hypothetical protein
MRIQILVRYKDLLAKIIRRAFAMKPEPQAHLVALTGAVMIFTPGGVVLLTPSAARAVARELPDLASLSDNLTLRQPQTS